MVGLLSIRIKTSRQNRMKNREGHAGSLKRQLGLIDTTFLLMGAVIGSGIFLTPGLVAADLPSPGLLLIVWLAGGLITLSGALTFAELGAMYPEAGGQYVYLREAFGPAAGFLFGWGFFVFIMCGGVAALAAAFAEFLEVFVPVFSSKNLLIHTSVFGKTISLSAAQIVGVAAILLLSFVNSRGIRTSVKIQNAFTVFRIGSVLAIVILGIFLGKKAGLVNFAHPFPRLGNFGETLHFVGLALVAIYWSYDGWYAVNCTAGEIKTPERNIPLGLILGTIGVTLIYLLVNAVFLLALPLDEMQGVLRIGEMAASALFGPGLATVISAVIMVTIFGCLNANVIYGPRVCYAMAIDGSFFRSMARLDPKFHLPSRAIWGQGFLASFFCLSGTFTSLLEFLVFALLVFFAATGVAVLALRRKSPGHPRPYKTWGYPVVPLIFSLVCLAIFVDIIIANPLKSLGGTILLAAGLPIYLYWRRPERIGDKTTRRD